MGLSKNKCFEGAYRVPQAKALMKKIQEHLYRSMRLIKHKLCLIDKAHALFGIDICLSGFSSSGASQPKRVSQHRPRKKKAMNARHHAMTLLWISPCTKLNNTVAVK